jgi:RHS repeat-associated protein
MGKLIAEYSNQISPNPTVSYTTTDHLGSPRVITDKAGNVISRRDFMPFGEELSSGSPNRSSYPTNPDTLRKKFTGYEKDQETGLDFAEARYYNNQHGRFTAIDPLLASGKSADPQTFNRYVYVGNNPVILTDPSGLDWFKRGNKYEWSADNKTFNDGSSVEGSERIQLSAFGIYGYDGCVDAKCSKTSGVVLMNGGLWDWSGGFLELLNDMVVHFSMDLKNVNLKNDFNSFAEDPFGERALGNPALNMALMGFGAQAQMAKTLGRGGLFVEKEVAKDTASVLLKAEVRQVEQYSLRAAKDGFYPVMKRGFKDPVEEIFLKQGDVWKFGATINPATRYTQKFLRETGSGLIFKTEFVTSSFKQAIQVEKLKIINFRTKTGFLPPGNKIVN